MDEKIFPALESTEVMAKRIKSLEARIKELENQSADRGKWTETYFKKWQEIEAKVKELEEKLNQERKDKNTWLVAYQKR